MENESFFEFNKLLETENQILDSVSAIHKNIRKSLKEKNWENLVSSIEEMNTYSESFINIDSKRDSIQKKLSPDELQNYSEMLRTLRRKLLKSKVENEALKDYTAITSGFLQGVLDKVPQGRAKIYSREGRILQTQPTSVVLNINY